MTRSRIWQRALVLGLAAVVAACDGVPPQPHSCPDATERGCGVVAIPGGTSTLGGDSVVYYDTPSAGTMTISGFSLDAYEVTVARFRRFWNAGHPRATSPLAYIRGSVTWTGGGVTEPDTTTGCTWNETAGALETHPINCVDWYTAQAFCAWDGGRLPTEAEWEYAARGTSVGGLTPERPYPWGTPDPSTTCDRAEWNRCSGDDGALTKRVGSFAATGGLYDMAGNVDEWNADWFAAYSNATCWGAAAQINPICNNSSTGYRAVRGGSWGTSDVVADLRSASRLSNTPGVRFNTIGFRCARTP